MANELQVRLSTGLTLYVQITKAVGGQIYNGSGFEDPLTANWATYAITVTEQSTTGWYWATMPVVAAGLYNVAFFLRAGGSPAATDQVAASGFMDWSGTIEIVQSGDAFARLGAPAGASIAADLAEIEGETDGIAAIPTTAAPTAAVVAAAVLAKCPPVLILKDSFSRNRALNGKTLEVGGTPWDADGSFFSNNGTLIHSGPSTGYVDSTIADLFTLRVKVNLNGSTEDVDLAFRAGEIPMANGWVARLNPTLGTLALWQMISSAYTLRASVSLPSGFDNTEESVLSVTTSGAVMTATLTGFGGVPHLATVTFTSATGQANTRVGLMVAEVNSPDGLSTFDDFEMFLTPATPYTWPASWFTPSPGNWLLDGGDVNVKTWGGISFPVFTDVNGSPEVSRMFSFSGNSLQFAMIPGSGADTTHFAITPSGFITSETDLKGWTVLIWDNTFGNLVCVRTVTGWNFATGIGTIDHASPVTLDNGGMDVWLYPVNKAKLDISQRVTALDSAGIPTVAQSGDCYPFVSKITSGTITIVNNLAANGTITIAEGSDNYHVDNRSVDVPGPSADYWPDLTGSTLGLYVDGALLVAGTVVTPTGSQVVRFEPTAAETIRLKAGTHYYAIWATLQTSGHQVMLAAGIFNVLDGQGGP